MRSIFMGSCSLGGELLQYHLLVEEVEDGAFLRELLVAMEPELPAPKPKKPMAKKE